MKTCIYYLFLYIIIFVTAVTGCKKKTEEEPKTEPTHESNFDATKGWKLLQTAVNDDVLLGTTGSADMWYYDMDFLNNNLRIYYSQGRSSQQSYLYVNTRVDEFGSDGKLTKRDELTWTSEQIIACTEKGYYYKFFLRNNKNCLLRYQKGSPSNSVWQIYENGTMVSQCKEVAGEYQGRPTFMDENNIYSCGSYNRSDNKTLAFTAKRFYNNTWEYTNSGYYQDNIGSNVIGAERINNVLYEFLGGVANANGDSMMIAVMQYNDSTQKWSQDFRQVFAGQYEYISSTGLYGESFGQDAPFYFSNNGTPLMVTRYGLKNYKVFKADITNRLISMEADITFPERIYSPSLVAFNGEVYMGYRLYSGEGSGPTTVAKLKGTTPVYVGQPGITIKSSQIFLKVINSKLYSITYCPCTHGEIYVATPE